MIRAVPKPEPRPKRPRKPLKRSWMRKKTPRRIARETPAEKYYKHWIHAQPCVCGCGQPVQQSHFRSMTGIARKESNFQSIAQCAPDHRDFTEARGRFAGLTKLERFVWFTVEIKRVHARFKEQHGCRPEDWQPTHVS